MKRYQVWGLLLVIPLVLGACSDSGTGPGDIKGGNTYVSADLSGNIAGKFHAKGGLFDISGNGYAWGFRGRNAEAEVLIVQGVDGDVEADDFEGRSIHIFVANPKKTTYSIDEYCDEDSDVIVSSCAGIGFLDTTGDGSYYWMTSGTLNITTLTKDRAAGTFEASGIGFDGSSEEATLHLKNGKFDVQIMDLGDVRGGLRNLSAT
jgi:hypothetical protein